MARSNTTMTATQPSAAANDSQTHNLRRSILEYLAAHNSMTIASCNQNVPWAAAVFYVSDEFDLYFFSNPHSRHGMNIAANSAVGVAIHEDYSDWKAIKGIQLEGRAERVRSPKAMLRFWELYRKKFPFVQAFFKPGPLREKLQSRLAGVRVYRVLPNAIWYLDNSQGFGHREMLGAVDVRTK
ncbi:MAG: pyridoxamine 5'-phosphate oxidase family protein [Acidobacteria bacterium]|nr:pyridoxamine 5'-phosphate oxidase family protein [Acidobacteriota bacterium]